MRTSWSKTALIAQAFTRGEGGMNLADTFHPASARNCVGFGNFDADLNRMAQEFGAITTVVTP